MTFLHAVILSIIEGITEFLPISSTGHIILTAKLLSIPQTEFAKSFEIFIQLGAIFAVVVMYWRTLMKKRKAWLPIIVAFIPTGVLGLIFYKIIKQYLLGNPIVVLLALFIGGIMLIAIEYYHKNKSFAIREIEDISIKNSFLIGLFQSVAMIPGVSRSAATIIGAQFLGVSREAAVEFSFLLAVPTMAAATGLDLLKSHLAFTVQQYQVLMVGFITAFIVAILAIKFFLRFIQRHTFIPFGIYRIVLSVVYWLIIIR